MYMMVDCIPRFFYVKSNMIPNYISPLPTKALPYLENAFVQFISLNFSIPTTRLSRHGGGGGGGRGGGGAVVISAHLQLSCSYDFFIVRAKMCNLKNSN